MAKARHVDPAPFVRAMSVVPERIGDRDEYPFSLPAVRSLMRGELQLHPRVTFFVGENGSGKSTLVEALAIASKLKPEGGGRTYQHAVTTRAAHPDLHRRLDIERAEIAPMNGFFLRAESVFNLATAIEQLPKPIR